MIKTVTAVSAAPDRRVLGTEGSMAGFHGATTWLNSAPLSAQQLRGKVVLVDFWTYSCINCIRSMPYVRAWAAKYREQGLSVVGVHTPEFAFEEDLVNINAAVERAKAAQVGGSGRLRSGRDSAPAGRPNGRHSRG